MPVDVVGCGTRTENLFDETYPNIRLDMPEYKSIFVGDGEFTLSTTAEQHGSSANLFLLTGRVNSGATTSTNGVWKENPRTITSLNGYVTIAYRYYDDEKSDPRFNTAMLNLGSEALPYEPYGYKLHETITNGTDTIATPIYIGSEPIHRIGEHADYVDYSSSKIMRRIKKLVLTGEENWTHSTSEGKKRVYTTGIEKALTSTAKCSHFVVSETFLSYPDSGVLVINHSSTIQALIFGVTDMPIASASDFSSYLAAKYAAGTPATVWYVLETPTEEDPPVPFPELPTLSGTNTLTVDTTVKPSRIDLTGRIKTS
jgi:hypothetical protein